MAKNLFMFIIWPTASWKKMMDKFHLQNNSDFYWVITEVLNRQSTGQIQPNKNFYLALDQVQKIKQNMWPNSSKWGSLREISKLRF